jgi:hypothetical protein
VNSAKQCPQGYAIHPSTSQHLPTTFFESHDSFENKTSQFQLFSPKVNEKGKTTKRIKEKMTLLPNSNPARLETKTEQKWRWEQCSCDMRVSALRTRAASVAPRVQMNE